MALFSFIIISLINSIFSLSNKNKFNTNINYYMNSDEFDPFECFPYFINTTDFIEKIKLKIGRIFQYVF